MIGEKKMQKTIEIDLGEFSDDELLTEMKLRGYFEKEITELQAQPVPNLFKLRTWEIACSK